MVKESSPFTPGLPVPKELFTGRKDEINLMLRAVKQVASGKQENLFITGERGIGKSSIASFVKLLAERDHDLVGCHVLLGGVSTLEEMVRRIFERLVNESVEKPWYGKLKDVFGNRIEQIGLFGTSIRFAPPKEELKGLVNGFAAAMRRLVERLAPDKKGILVILDDVNGLAGKKEFGDWLKSMADEIATSGRPCPLLVMLVGLEERREAIIKNQPSAGRIFDVIRIHVMNEQERSEFYKKAFSQAGMRVAPDALARMCRVSGGFPALLHEIGEATFWEVQDNLINDIDAIRGILAAANRVGEKYMQPNVYQAIRSEKYRSILRKLASDPFAIEFEKQSVSARLSKLEQKVFNNFLIRMRKLGVIETDEEKGSGHYRFTNELHYLYIWMESMRSQPPRR